MDAPNTAMIATKRDPRGAGHVLAMGVILLALTVLLPLIIPVAVVLFIARSGEYVPRFIHWVGRKRGKAWAQ